MAAQKTTVPHINVSAGSEDATPSTLGGTAADGEDLGRLSVRETIQRARSSGVCFSDRRLSFRLPFKTGRFA